MATEPDHFTLIATSLNNLKINLDTFETELQNASDSSNRFELHDQIYTYINKQNFPTNLNTLLQETLNTILPETEPSIGGKKRRKTKKTKKRRSRRSRK